MRMTGFLLDGICGQIHRRDGVPEMAAEEIRYMGLRSNHIEGTEFPR